mgnify:CR=1 FL=1
MKNNNPPALGQKENAKHGEVFFPVQKYITRLAADYPVITTHWHDEAELTLITKGSCTYQIDLLEYEAKEGDIIFIPPLLLHSISIRDCDEFYSETYVFHINFLGGNNTDICSSRYLTPLINHEFAMPYLIAPKHPAYTSLCKCFMRITNLYSSQEFGYELALKAFLLQAIFLLLQYSCLLYTSPSPRDESIQVAELAGLCYFSEYHFMRFFKKHMNMTCVQYINNVRLEKSVEQFERGNTSILDVSLSVGFHNLSYFHRAFKKRYHMTPLSFIKSLE